MIKLKRVIVTYTTIDSRKIAKFWGCCSFFKMRYVHL